MHFSAATNAANCTHCPSGKFQLKPGQPFCDVCQPNSQFSATAGHCVCNAKHFRCPADATGEAQPGGQDCGDAHLVGAAERNKNAGACIACDIFATGADCSAPGAHLITLKSARGFWRATSTTAVFHACNPLRPGECRGAPIEANRTRDAQCAAGHTGPKCSACDTVNGYVRKFGGACAKCAPGEGLAILIAIPLLAAGCGLALWWLQKHGKHGKLAHGLAKRTIKVRILLGFGQVVTRLAASYDLVLPSAVAQFYRALSFLEVIDIGAFAGSAGCVHATSFIDTVFVQTLFALAIFTVLGLAYRWAAGNERTAYMNAALFFSFLIYTSITSTLFFALGCKAYEDGESYLVVDASINCSDASYLRMRAWALSMIPVFVVGIPTGYYLALHRHHFALVPKPRKDAAEQQYAAALFGANVWGHKQREDDASIAHLAFLWRGYWPKFYWFEVSEMLRKFLMTGMPILLNIVASESKYIVLAYGMLVSTLTSTVQVLGNPYMAAEDRLLAGSSHFQAFMTLVAGTALRLDPSGSNKELVSTVVLLFGVPAALMLVGAVLVPDTVTKLIAKPANPALQGVLDKIKGAVDATAAAEGVPAPSGVVDYEQAGRELTATGCSLVLAGYTPQACALVLLRSQVPNANAGAEQLDTLAGLVRWLARVDGAVASDKAAALPGGSHVAQDVGRSTAEPQLETFTAYTWADPSGKLPGDVLLRVHGDTLVVVATGDDDDSVLREWRASEILCVEHEEKDDDSLDSVTIKLKGGGKPFEFEADDAAGVIRAWRSAQSHQAATADTALALANTRVIV